MNLFDKFKKLTNINLEIFYQDFIDFFDNYHYEIVNYYTEIDTIYPDEAFTYYYDILNRLEEIISKISLYKGNFDTIEIWGIISELDDFKMKLDMIPSYPRLYKVGFVKKVNQGQLEYETYIMKSHDTIESVARNYNQNLTDLILLNELEEEKWTERGGTKIILKSNISASIASVEEESVFDILIGKNILGKDLPNYFKINEETEDLEVMTPEQTFLQSVQTLFQLKRGEIPEYPMLGVDKNIYAECTKGNVGFTFPIMLRQLMLTLDSDDSILSFSIDNIEFDEKNNVYYIYASVQNRLLDNLKFVTNIK